MIPRPRGSEFPKFKPGTGGGRPRRLRAGSESGGWTREAPRLLGPGPYRHRTVPYGPPNLTDIITSLRLNCRPRRVRSARAREPRRSEASCQIEKLNRSAAGCRVPGPACTVPESGDSVRPSWRSRPGSRQPLMHLPCQFRGRSFRNYHMVSAVGVF